jgi:hypothetical protein
MDMKTPKFFLIAFVLDISLMATYTVLNYYELSRLLVLSVTEAMQWNPITTSVFFQFSTAEASNVVEIWWYNWSFFALLAIITINLLVIWMLEQKFLRQKQG